MSRYDGEEGGIAPMSEKRLDRLAVAASQKSKEREYWLSKLSGKYEKSSFPYDYARGTERAQEEASFCFPEDLVSRLLQVSAGADSKLHVVLAAALASLLGRMANCGEVVLGTPIYKQQEEAEFINAVLPLRVQTEGPLSFRECLFQMQETIVTAVEHQSYPMEIAAEQLGLPTDDPLAHPLFETALLLENIHDEHYFANAKWTSLFAFRRTQEEICVVVKYNARLYRKETIAGVFARFTIFLREALANPDQPLHSINLLLPGEKERLLGTLAGCSVDYPQQQSVQQWLEQHAASTPHAPAVVCGDVTLTYGQLNAKANQLARKLQASGVRTGDVVGLLFGPSPDMMISMLATIKAGGAFLPIDPEYPDERLSFMVEDSRATAVLTQRDYAARISGNSVVICLDDADLYAADIPADNVPIAYGPHDLAYVIYTSGSTGRPKGVMIEHRSLVNLALWHNRAYDVVASDRSIKYAGFGFDASVWEVFPYLLAGASIHVVPANVRLDAKKLNDFFVEQGITIAFLPTMMCEQFMELHDPKLASLRILLTGGDRLKRYKPGSYRLFNNYGPTENTVVTTYVEIQTGAGVIPIGRPIDNTLVYVLDRHLQLQPLGVSGEICVSGVGLARGYLGRPDLTTEKFVPHPFIDGERLYRTGDLGRWREDGTLEYLGRQDDQVKVRGYRIEPGEIELLLRQREDVREAVVLVREDENGQNMLCAYYTGPTELTATVLRDDLTAQLPAYMIPAYFVRLEQLPVTANGKLDTKALPNPKEHVLTGKQYVAPQGDIEKMLVRIWAEVLGVSEERVGVNDTFFDLGGNSFQLVQVVNKLNEAFDREIAVAVMFQYTTVSALSGYVKRLESGEEDTSLDIADNEKMDEGFDTMEQTLLILGGRGDD
ncbi:non-ribosomal peptide synthetase [Paenibacillus sp. 481]|uniref:non-ribosomal peptide synthetase n=1 Tax=Paenibacillus sp. 481 TaxID=2835869 RepID=UPI001E5179B9|nr:non-ribosomal peptide synthetase [Paenibacillus sp. 481]UHA74005.1 amino acid adenylation domain-containing protein [Paenibacillus sp. 481]